MDFRAGSDVADLALDQDRRIDGFEGFNGLFRLADVLLERERRQVEDDGVKAALATSRACASEWVWSAFRKIG